MTQPFRLTIVTESTGEEVHLSGEFPDDAWKVLIDFRDEARDLFERLKVCTCLNISVTFKWDERSGMQVETHKTPTHGDLSIILHRMRPFLLQDEPIEFGKIVNLLRRHIRHDKMEQALWPLKDLFSGKDFQQQVQVSSGDTLINSEQTLKIWLNAFEYHRDGDKKDIIRDLDSRFPSDMSRALFTGMLLDKVRAVLALSHVIHGFEKREGFRVTLPVADA